MNRTALLAAMLGWAVIAAPSFAQDAAAPGAAASAPAPPLRIVYLSREADPAYQPVPEESGVFRLPIPEPSPGAELAIKDTRAMVHAAGLAVELVKRTIPEGEPIDSHLHDATDGDPVAVIADLPADDFSAVAKAAAGSVPIFNIRHREDALRGAFCGTGVFHVIPSTSMLTDALAQFTVQRNWRRVLILRGPAPDDQVLANAFATSAKKFGARIVDTKEFAYGNDPRKREQIDVALMTTGDDYDVVFLADTGGDFGRTVPYQMAKPRPVIGTEGLRATAWDPDLGALRFAPGQPSVHAPRAPRHG